MERTGKIRCKAVIKHTGANRRCLCDDYRGKVGIEEIEWRG